LQKRFASYSTLQTSLSVNNSVAPNLVGQTIGFCGLPGCEAARFVTQSHRDARPDTALLPIDPCAKGAINSATGYNLPFFITS
jgi:hypothetical protein